MPVKRHRGKELSMSSYRYRSTEPSEIQKGHRPETKGNAGQPNLKQAISAAQPNTENRRRQLPVFPCGPTRYASRPQKKYLLPVQPQKQRREASYRKLRSELRIRHATAPKPTVESLSCKHGKHKTHTSEPLPFRQSGNTTKWN